MPVAPSFATYKVISEQPFTKNGKLYITVEHPNTHNHRDVRFYSDAEFAKAYGSKIAAKTEPGTFKGLKIARGFEKGPILVVRRNRPEDEDWLGKSPARYAVGIGWYFPSTAEFPTDAPPHLKYLLLSWEEFRDGDDEHMKSPGQISEILQKKANKREWFEIG